MAVPARPVEGAPVDTVWGQVAHDTAVAQDFQSGTVVITTSGSPPTGSLTLTFPRPFASAPGFVGLMVSGTGADQAFVGVDTVTASSCRLGLRAGVAFGYTCRWFAIGPRA